MDVDSSVEIDWERGMGWAEEGKRGKVGTTNRITIKNDLKKKKKNHMIMSLDTGKASDKIQQPTMIRIQRKRNRGDLNLI